MVRFGYTLSGEEHRPADLIRQAAMAEEAGFDFAMISDHYHPWIDAQGQAPFVWTVLGAIARETSRIEVGTGVTCPTMRIHPAIVAQAAATTADLFDGRFFLGVGTGENLNEHVLGDHWPPYAERSEMLDEALAVIRGLWEGRLLSHRGEHYVVENARLYTLPERTPPIVVAASGPESAAMAGAIGDGLVVTAPQQEVVQTFRSEGGQGKPVYGQATACWAPSVEEGARTLAEIWPNAGIPGQLSQELPLPMHFEQAAKLVTPDLLAEKLPVGPDVDRFVSSLGGYLEAGVDHLYVHQVGPDQEGFMGFFRDELRPALERMATPQPATART